MDLMLLALMSAGSSREIFRHLLAKLAGKWGIGRTLSHRRNLLWIGKGSASGNSSSFISFSSCVCSRISLFSSASFCWTTKSSSLASSSYLASCLRRLMIDLSLSYRTRLMLKLFSSTLISPWCQLRSCCMSLKEVSAESYKIDCYRSISSMAIAESWFPLRTQITISTTITIILLLTSPQKFYPPSPSSFLACPLTLSLPSSSAAVLFTYCASTYFRETCAGSLWFQARVVGCPIRANSHHMPRQWSFCWSSRERSGREARSQAWCPEWSSRSSSNSLALYTGWRWGPPWAKWERTC